MCPWHEGLGEEGDRLTVVTSRASGLQNVPAKKTWLHAHGETDTGALLSVQCGC